jgi:hypothetical protein
VFVIGKRPVFELYCLSVDGYLRHPLIIRVGRISGIL